MAEPISIVAAESVTRLDDVAGRVLVAGSHGGVIAAYLGATFSTAEEFRRRVAKLAIMDAER